MLDIYLTKTFVGYLLKAFRITQSIGFAAKIKCPYVKSFLEYRFTTMIYKRKLIS